MTQTGGKLVSKTTLRDLTRVNVTRTVVSVATIRVRLVLHNAVKDAVMKAKTAKTMLIIRKRAIIMGLTKHSAVTAVTIIVAVTVAIVVKVEIIVTIVAIVKIVNAVTEIIIAKVDAMNAEMAMHL